MRWRVQVAMSDDITGWKPKLWAGDRRTTLVLEGDTPIEVAEAAWRVGNRMGADADGREWSSDVRSMCVGDVVMMRPEWGNEVEGAALQVQGAGWSEAPDMDIRWSAEGLREIGAAR